MSTQKQTKQIPQILKPWKPDITVLKTIGKGQKTQIKNTIIKNQGIEDKKLEKQLQKQLQELTKQKINNLDTEHIENLSRESLTQRHNRGTEGLPTPILKWVNQETAQRLNQKIPFTVKPANQIEFEKEITGEAGKIAGSYHFSEDKVKLGGTYGNLNSNREYVYPVHAHELTHKSNIESILENPEATRNAAQTLLESAENNIINNTDFQIPEVSQKLLAGETIRRIYQRDQNKSFKQIANQLQEPEYTEKNSYLIDEVVKDLNLEELILRDEVIAFTVTYLEEDIFKDKEEFYNELNSVEQFYNNKDNYPSEAGSKITEELENIHSNHFEDSETNFFDPYRSILNERETYLLKDF